MKELPDTATRPPPASNREAYCGRLGHFVPLSYCMHPAQENPCFRILDCWWQIFDVQGYLQTVLPQSVYEKLASRPEPQSRMEGILKVLSELKERNPEDS